MSLSPNSVDATVSIALGERSYPILIGQDLIGSPKTWEGLPKAGAAMVVTNDTVGPLYAKQLCEALRPQYPQVHVVTLPDNKSKEKPIKKK